MPAKTDKPTPQPGDVTASGTLPDGRPYNDVFLGEGRTYRITRIWVSESDDAYDKSENPDGTINGRLNGRLQVAASIVEPKTTIDDFEKITAFDLEVLFRAFNRLNLLPRADLAGNA